MELRHAKIAIHWERVKRMEDYISPDNIHDKRVAVNQFISVIAYAAPHIRGWSLAEGKLQHVLVKSNLCV